MTERTIPDPPAGMRYIAEPLPDPPRRGLWLDPDDPKIARYHNGKKWSDYTTSSLPSLEEDNESWGSWLLSLRHTIPGDLWVYIAITVFGILGTLLLGLASAFHTGTAGFEWANRLGLFCILGVFITFAGYAIVAPIVSPKGWTITGRILVLIAAAIPLTAVTWLYWNRIRDALWLH